MNEYIVLKAFEQHNTGDTVLMTERQAKYLLLNGSLKLKPKSGTKKPQEKGE